MNYKEFVKAHMGKMKSSNLPIAERMKHIAKLWKEHKSKGVKGGQIDQPVITKQQILGQKLRDEEQDFEYRIKHSLYGQYATPFIKPSVMMDRGIPWILAQHPNQYSANPNQVLVYRNLSQFMKSPFYKKYQDRLVEVAERSGYATTSAKIIPGKDFRIVFRSKSPDDNTQYYLDCKDADEFMDVLDEAKESNILAPIEFLSKRFMDLNRQLSQKEAENNAVIWQAGFQKSYDELEPIIKQQQSDIQQLQQQIEEERQRSSSSSDWLGDIAEGAVSVFKALI